MPNWAKSYFIIVGFLVAMVLSPMTASAQSLSGSEHDFTAATGPNATFQGAADICVTCHVPHLAATTKLIWNHTLSSNTLGFTASQTTASGTDLPTDIGGPTAPGTSRFCLSCHDGSVAVGDVFHGTDWSTTNFLTGDHVVAPSGNLDTNHPVEVPYPDQASAVYNGITSGADPTGYQASPTSVKLFGTGAGLYGIGCASCHNPHDSTTGGTPHYFLRTARADLCTSCHIK